MDLEQLRTFLEVCKTRHFARAADNLFITQAAVSARIRQLEQQVGHRLLTRDRNNIQLTAAGHQFVSYAEAIVDTWNKALMETGPADAPLIGIGCLASLREIYLDNWLVALLQRHGERRLQLESLNTLEIISRVRDGSLDIGMVYDSPRSPDLWVEAATSFELTLVSTRPGISLAAGIEDYVHVDWGTSLAAARDTRPPGIVSTRARLDSAFLARRLVLAIGGCAFLPGPLIADDLAAGRLHAVAGSASPSRSVFLIGATDRRSSPGVAELAADLCAMAAAG
jgi:DNA-binding transcriptional LysR family regulator